MTATAAAKTARLSTASVLRAIKRDEIPHRIERGRYEVEYMDVTRWAKAQPTRRDWTRSYGR